MKYLLTLCLIVFTISLSAQNYVNAEGDTITGTLHMANSKIAFDPQGGAPGDLLGLKVTHSGDNSTKLHLFRNFSYETNDVNFITMDGSGKLGIGTTSPAYKLSVVGTGGFSNHLYLDKTVYIKRNEGGYLASIYNERNPGGTDKGFTLQTTSGGDNIRLINGTTTSLITTASNNVEIPNGNLGIGTSPSSYKLDVNGTAHFTDATYFDGGNNHVNTTNNEAGFIFKKDGIMRSQFAWVESGGYLGVYNHATSTWQQRWKNDGTSELNVDTDINGNLDVNGNAVISGSLETIEITVSTTPGSIPDYVFQPSYQLRSLSELEDYVKTNSHLPNIPSANQMAANGQNLGSLQLKLLEKIEELTLYTIDQEKQLRSKDDKIEQLEEGLKTLLKRVEQLEASSKTKD